MKRLLWSLLITFLSGGFCFAQSKQTRDKQTPDRFKQQLTITKQASPASSEQNQRGKARV